MNGMGWGGNIPEFSRAPGRMENFPTVKEHDRQKGRGEEPSGFRRLFFSPFLAGRGAHESLESRLRLAAASDAARCRFNPCRQTAGQ